MFYLLRFVFTVLFLKLSLKVGISFLFVSYLLERKWIAFWEVFLVESESIKRELCLFEVVST